MKQESGILSALAPRVRAVPPPEAIAPCGAGLWLRAALAAQAVLVVAALLNAQTSLQALQFWAAASVLVLPAVLAWLWLMCRLRGGLMRCAPPLRYGGAAALGAVLGGLTGALWPSLTGVWTAAPAVHMLGWLGCSLAGGLVGLAGLHGLVIRTRASAPAAAQARLAELQARIRPHFLFNTLNSAIALAVEQPQQSVAMLEDLAELFRVALAESGATTSLDAELALAQRYLAIEQRRFGPRLQVSWSIDPQAGPAALPPLLLQPLLENAVRHGVEPSTGPVDIQVATQRIGNRARVCISNALPAARLPAGHGGIPGVDGAVDATAEQRYPGQRGQGQALRNVRERLALLHDLDASIESRCIATGAQHGHAPRFVVTLWLPLAGARG